MKLSKEEIAKLSYPERWKLCKCDLITLQVIDIHPDCPLHWDIDMNEDFPLNNANEDTD